MTAEPRPRHYLMCAPEHFAVEYAINPWMDPTQPVDAELARRQWEDLRQTLTGLGHTVDTLTPLAGLPVFPCSAPISPIGAPVCSFAEAQLATL